MPAGAVVVDVAQPARHVEAGQVAVAVIVGVCEQNTGKGGQVAVTVLSTIQFGSMQRVVVLGWAGVGHGGVTVEVTVRGQEGELDVVVFLTSSAGMASAAASTLESSISTWPKALEVSTIPAQEKEPHFA